MMIVYESVMPLGGGLKKDVLFSVSPEIETDRCGSQLHSFTFWIGFIYNLSIRRWYEIPSKHRKR